MLIDLSPWGKRNPLEDKLKLIKQAIGQLHLIRFTYVNVKGESSTRTVEPYTLIMKGQQWYLYAYCSMRSGFRMFKLNRIKELTVTNSVYLRRPLPEEPLPWDHDWYREENLARLQLRIFPPARQLAEESFGVDQLHKETDKDSWLAAISFPEDNWLYGFILSFGEHVEVISPPHIRQIIQDKAMAIAALYAKT